MAIPSKMFNSEHYISFT